MEHTHTRFGKCVIEDITQGQLEKFQTAMKGAGELPMSVFFSKSLKAARDCGILGEPVLTDEQIEKAKPGLIHWLADCLAEDVQEANRIDPL